MYIMNKWPINTSWYHFLKEKEEEVPEGNKNYAMILSLWYELGYGERGQEDKHVSGNIAIILIFGAKNFGKENSIFKIKK